MEIKHGYAQDVEYLVLIVASLLISHAWWACRLHRARTVAVEKCKTNPKTCYTKLFEFGLVTL